MRLQRLLTHYGDSGHPADVFGRLARITIGEFRGDASRDDALTLLAADAFMTYACEAAVGSGLGGRSSDRANTP